MDQKDYLRESARTVAGGYYAELVSAPHLDFMLQAVIAGGAWADRVKRALFYGKETPGSNFSTTSLTHRPEVKDLLHAVLGCITESAEMAEHVRDVLSGAKPFDRVNLIEETGDLLWYAAVALRFAESDFAETFDTNIAKLRKRFPDKFTEEAALSRDLVGERAVLELGTKPTIAQTESVHLNPGDTLTLHATGGAVSVVDIGFVETVGYLEVLDPPAAGTRWRHTSGRIYTVLTLTNELGDERYPLTVVYRGENGRVWSRRADDWHRSMKPVPCGLLPPDGTPDGTAFILFKGDVGAKATWEGGCWVSRAMEPELSCRITPEIAAFRGWEITGMPPKAAPASGSEWDPQP